MSGSIKLRFFFYGVFTSEPTFFLKLQAATTTTNKKISFFNSYIQMKIFQVNLIDSVPLKPFMLSFSLWPVCKLWLCAILLCDKISLSAFWGFSAKIETSSLITGHMARMEREELLLDMFAYVYGYLCGVYLNSNRSHHIAKKTFAFLTIIVSHDCNKYTQSHCAFFLLKL